MYKISCKMDTNFLRYSMFFHGGPTRLPQHIDVNDVNNVYVCLLKTFNRYIRLAESICFVNYVQPYVFQILEENLHDVAYFGGYRLVPGWFQAMSVASWLASYSFWMVSGGLDGSRSFQVVPRFNKYIDVPIKKCRLAGVYPENPVGRGGLRK